MYISMHCEAESERKSARRSGERWSSGGQKRCGLKFVLFSALPSFQTFNDVVKARTVEQSSRVIPCLVMDIPRPSESKQQSETSWSDARVLLENSSRLHICKLNRRVWGFGIAFQMIRREAPSPTNRKKKWHIYYSSSFLKFEAR